MNSIKYCVIFFENDPIFIGKISRNLLTETNDMIGVFPWRRIATRFDDQDFSHVLLYFEQFCGIQSEKNIEHAFRVVASKISFHPIQNYWRSLQWNGVPRIREVLHHLLGADVSDHNEACLRVFMQGAVKQIFQSGFKSELMLILISRQGAGKSTFLCFLAISDEWSSEDLERPDDEKIYQQLVGH